MKILKDKNNKTSHKRTIAILSFINSVILCYLLLFFKIGNITLVSIFLSASVGEGFATLLEK